MRALTEQETKTLFTKLASYTGKSLTDLIAERPDGSRSVFRMIKDRVYYVDIGLANLATNIARDKLISVGTCIGKFTKTGRFRLHITSLPILAQHAQNKIYVKSNGEGPFLFGGNVLKAHVGRWSDDFLEHSGVVVCSMQDIPLGFGVTNKGTVEARRLDPTGIVAFRQADCGEYLRDEDTLFATG